MPEYGWNAPVVWLEAKLPYEPDEDYRNNDLWVVDVEGLHLEDDPNDAAPGLWFITRDRIGPERLRLSDYASEKQSNFKVSERDFRDPEEQAVYRDGYEYGEGAGILAANSLRNSPEQAREAWRRMRSGENPVYEMVEENPLSGEWAGGPSIYEVLDTIRGQVSADPEAYDDAARTWEEGYYDGAKNGFEQNISSFLGTQDEPGDTYLPDEWRTSRSWEEVPPEERRDIGGYDQVWQWWVPFRAYPNGSFEMGTPGDEHWMVEPELSDPHNAVNKEPNERHYREGILPWEEDASWQMNAENPGYQYQGSVLFHPSQGEIVAWPMDQHTLREHDWLTPEFKQRLLDKAREQYAKWGYADPEDDWRMSKVSMAMTPEMWQAVLERTPYFYHVSDIHRQQQILDEGIRTDAPSQPGIEPREGVVYLFPNEPDAIDGAEFFLGLTNAVIFKIDASQLDPTAIGADEDYLSSNPEAFYRAFGGPTPSDTYGDLSEGDWAGYEPWDLAAETGNDWALFHPLLDDPDVAWGSYAENRTVAYAKPIPPKAIMGYETIQQARERDAESWDFRSRGFGTGNKGGWRTDIDESHKAAVLAKLRPPVLSFERLGRLVEAAWPDIMAKAKRMIMDGNVTVLTNRPDFVAGKVLGDGTDNDGVPDMHHAEFYREDSDSNAITQSTCDCKWQQYRWDRTRPYKKFEGRVCSHLLALYWKSKATPMDIGDMPAGYQVPVGQRGPAQQEMPIPQQTQEAPMAEQQPVNPPPQVPSTQQLIVPQRPQSPFAPPKQPQRQQRPQREQLQLFDIAPPPNPQGPVPGWSMPGATPPDPTQGPTLPGTFSSWQKEGMALSPEVLQRHIDKNGPYVYHKTYPSNVDSILERGILPRDQALGIGGEGFEWNSGSIPTSNTTYLRHIPHDEDLQGWVQEEGPMVQIDLRKLDPSKIVMDEDNIEGHWMGQGDRLWQQQPELFENISPWWSNKLDRQDQTSTGSWAFAYHDAVPPEAISGVLDWGLDDQIVTRQRVD
ncbi:MAG: hypothetical protein KGL39_28280 [Patescibacteria group bacterium]|nr:hypothetical protein [Patescibacteria group bacterium]